MARERGRDDTRSAIAVHAARLMAQDGIEDYGLAKRKAANQLGIPDSSRLPNNDEIDAALREYQDIYRNDDQDQGIRMLREQAGTSTVEPFENVAIPAVVSIDPSPSSVIRMRKRSSSAIRNDSAD